MKSAAHCGGGAKAQIQSKREGAHYSAKPFRPQPFRRLGEICAEVVANLRRQRAAACSERVAENFPADIQIAIGALDDVVAEGGP